MALRIRRGVFTAVVPVVAGCCDSKREGNKMLKPATILSTNVGSQVRRRIVSGLLIIVSVADLMQALTLLTL
ncbi:MAG TPA: hypothetical protein DHV83_07205 [Prevotella sp.]|nr:hypothetical protein [Prevotella sp.]